jgi:FLVCR family feline leukemia virus subgroup C receptor-related protein
MTTGRNTLISFVFWRFRVRNSVTVFLSVLYFQGLRVSAILGALGTACGSWIKVASASPDMFAVAFVGQTLVAVSQVFILSVPARLAAVWFGPSEVSSACSIGVFGNQVSRLDSC